MFPFSESLQLDEHGHVYADDQAVVAGVQTMRVQSATVLEKIWPLLTSERRARIEQVVTQRCFSHSVVLEDIYDRGNMSAVMRSAEAFGFARMHMIEKGDKFKESQRTTAGADKWIELKKWKSTQDCVQALKAQGTQIVVTHLSEKSKAIGEIDFSKPTALVLGNEKNGVSAEMIAAADHLVVIPMQGFVQSFNISVAGALCLYHMHLSLQSSAAGAVSSKIDFEQQQILKAVYALRTMDSAFNILKN